MKDKKIYLRDVVKLGDKEAKEILKTILDNNSKLKDALYEGKYEYNMDDQLYYGNEILGKDTRKYVDIRDHYSSFYLRLLDADLFLDNLDTTYLTDKQKDLYDEAYSYKTKKENIEMFTEEYYDCEEKEEKVCEQLLDTIETFLHEFEDVNEEDVLDYFIFNLEDDIYYGNLYYYNDDVNFKVYEDVNYTKEWF